VYDYEFKIAFFWYDIHHILDIIKIYSDIIKLYIKLNIDELIFKKKKQLKRMKPAISRNFN